MVEGIANILIKRDLNEYYYKKRGISELKEKIEYLEGKKNSISSGWKGNDWTDKLIDINAELDMCKSNLEDSIYLIDSIDRSLGILNTIEKEIINGLYLSNDEINIDQLCRKLNYSRSSIYKISDKAIYKMALYAYGKVDC